MAADRRILVVGLENAGKTRLLRTMSGDVTNLMPTRGCIVKTISYEGRVLSLLEVGGFARSVWRRYANADCVVFVVDAHDRGRIYEAATALAQLLREPRLAMVPVLVLCNKMDIFTSLKPEVLLTLFAPVLRGRPSAVLGCSAMTGDGVPAALAWLAIWLDRTRPRNRRTLFRCCCYSLRSS
ncbi:hypothetical protein CTAYLR_000071 [Chrysophaeum taylorii]|uniref:Uncharacterized protein n=1 Tax=Chrysophaeum taylorii TaxID=2483200 RepID=A0AAD7UGH9_9STRA|nr:hypothetical protein CTAYLR_000071 [Chrysophaeum taylorii]